MLFIFILLSLLTGGIGRFIERRRRNSMLPKNDQSKGGKSKFQEEIRAAEKSLIF